MGQPVCVTCIDTLYSLLNFIVRIHYVGSSQSNALNKGLTAPISDAFARRALWQDGLGMSQLSLVSLDADFSPPDYR